MKATEVKEKDRKEQFKKLIDIKKKEKNKILHEHQIVKKDCDCGK